MSKHYPSFVKRSPGILNLWSPEVSGDWAKDVAQGHAYGREIVTYMRRTGHVALLNHVIKAMVGHGVWGGVEVGFHQIIAMEVVGIDIIKDRLAERHDYLEGESEAAM